jgi:hypothetical protein
MTVTGLVMVFRWNRLFPDRRDFANLAPLPIPIRDVFLANLIALISLAVLFAVDVNAFSAIFFPFIVTISDGQGGSFSKLLLMLRSHAATVFLSSLFSFFAVFATVGVLMLVVPKKLFASISLGIRIILVVALLSEFFANMLLQLFSGHLSGTATSYARLLPSFWFLGVYETLAGLANSAMGMLADRAVIVTTAAICISLGAYTLCYRQRFVRLAESLDVIGGPQHRHRIRFPTSILRVLFRSGFERACASFVADVLLRSERHMMFVGAYVGIGLVLTAQTVVDSLNHHATSAVPNPDLLAIPLMIAFFIITGLRFAFDMPAVASANWIFRLSMEHSPVNTRRPVRTMMLATLLPWQIAALFPFMYVRFGWRIAVLHTFCIMLLSATLIEFVLINFQKIPFTCTSHPDIRMLLMRILGAVFAVILCVPVLASIEQGMLLNPARFMLGAVVLGAAWYWILYRRREAFPSNSCILFEDAPPPQFELLKLT